MVSAGSGSESGLGIGLGLGLMTDAACGVQMERCRGSGIKRDGHVICMMFYCCSFTWTEAED